MLATTNTLPPRVVTRAIHAIRRGEQAAEGELWTLVYDLLRDRARLLLRNDGVADSLDPTDVVHHAYGKLGPVTLGACRDRWHLLRLATRAMRQVLVEEARRRRCRIAPEVWPSERFDQLALGAPLDDDSRLDVALAIEALAVANAQYADIVGLRHYGGLSIDDVARALRMRPRTVHLAWFRARAWLRGWLSRGGSAER